MAPGRERRWLLLVGGLLLASGCWLVSTAGRPKFGQDEAILVVWKDVFGRKDAPPQVRWIEGRELTCKDEETGRPGFPTPAGCLEGLTMNPSEVQVAWHDGDRFADTRLAHELWHAALFHQGVMDQGHRTPGFRPRAECPGPPHPPDDACGIVEVAVDSLRARML